MGVCCIVFDIDGMLFEFFMNFLDIEKNKMFSSHFMPFYAIFNIKKMFFSHFILFPTFLEKKIGEYKTIISQMFSSY